MTASLLEVGLVIGLITTITVSTLATAPSPGQVAFLPGRPLAVSAPASVSYMGLADIAQGTAMPGSLPLGTVDSWHDAGAPGMTTYRASMVPPASCRVIQSYPGPNAVRLFINGTRGCQDGPNTITWSVP